MVAGVFVLIVGLVTQGTVETVRGLLASQEFRSAWMLASREEDSTARARARSEILYRAGDPAGAWRESQAGLATSPADLGLLFYATSAALWLGDGHAAQETALRLRDALAAAELAPPDRASWEASVEAHLAQARAVLQQETTRARALGRARVLALLSLGGAAVLAAWSARGLSRADG